jgi:hypothetical protein
MNSLTDQEQYLTTGTSGTNFAIVSSGDTHTFNLPIASATNTGKLSSTDWNTFNNKVPYTGATSDVDLGVNFLKARTFYAEGNGGGGSYAIKNGATPSFEDGYTILSSNDYRLNILSTVSTITKAVYLGFSGVTATRTYTLPDASGTLALTSNLSSYVPYTGATSSVDLGAYTLTGAGIFSNPSGTTSGQINLKIGSSNASYVGYNSITALSNGVFAFISDISSGAALKDARFDFGSLTNNTTRTYTMPNASGTIALTSNIPSITGLVPYTGATSTVNLGTNVIYFNSAFVEGNGSTYGGAIAIKQYTSSIVAGSGYTCLFASPSTLGMTFGTSNSAFFDGSALTSNRTYTMPDASGTIALTSNLSSYLPLTGGTLTGALSGTSATFSSTLGVTGAATFSSSVNIASTTTIGGIDGSFLRTYSATNDTLRWAFINSSSGVFSIQQQGDNYVNQGDRLVINRSGNVGIGTSSPNYLLEVAKNINAADPLINVLNSNSGSSARAAYRSFSDTAGGQFGTVSSTFTIDPAIFANETYVYGSYGLMLYATNNMRFRAGGSERMRLTSDGILALNGSSDVGNGSLDKISFGHLNGSYGWIQTWNATTLYLNKAGNAVYAGTQRIDNNSDARLKDNIESVTNALNTILSLKGRKFNMKDENGKLRYGFIAQEVQPYLNDFVMESDRYYEKDEVKIENLLTLETSGSSWAALLVEAIKEQQAQIELLSNKIVALESK